MNAHIIHSWRVLLLDTKRSNPNHYLCIALRDALAAHPEVAHVASASYGEAVHRALDESCNLFIAFDGEEMQRDVCAKLATICGRSILWVTEDPYELGINNANSDIFNLVFSNDSESISSYGEKGRHLPLAACPSLHFLDIRADSDCRYDLFFAGTAWPNRVKLLKDMIGGMTGLKVKLALPHNEHLPPPELPLALSSFTWRTPNNQFARFANSSRVVLSLHREFSASPDGSPMAATPGPRLFEVAMAGGFQLVDLALAECGKYFVEDVEFAGFRSHAEAVEKLRHYLAHPEQRIAIAKAAQTKALNMHTYTRRVEVLLAEAAAITPSGVHEVKPHRPRVLHVTHNVAGVPPYGGVEIYQQMVGKALADEVDSFFYIPDQLIAGAECRLLDINGNVIGHYSFSTPAYDHLLSCPEREDTFARILAEFKINVVHFQHLIRHVPSLPYIARALGVRTLFSLHDYYPVCSEFNLIGYDGRFCAPETRSEAECDICLSHLRHAAHGSQSCRRAFYGRMLRHIDILHGNTTEVVDRYKQVFPMLRRHPRFEVAGVPSTESQAAATFPSIRPAPMRVALLGNFTRSKGGEQLLNVFEALRDDPIYFEVFGQIEPVLAQHLARVHYPNVAWHGGYPPGTLISRLAGIHVSLHASLWPETYCIALSEAWQAGLVPIVADIGALGLRVEHAVNGLKYGHDRPGQLVDLLRTLASDPGLLSGIRANIHPGLWATREQHMNWLAEIYIELAQRSTVVSADDIRRDSARPLTLFDCGVALTAPSWLRGGVPPSTVISPVPPPPSPIQPQQRLPRLLMLLSRARGFLHRNGISATLRRIFFELRLRWRSR